MLCKLSLAILILATFGHFTSAQVILPGRCPNAKVMDVFDLEAYTGRWFEYARFLNFFELNNKCNYAEYTALPNNTVGVANYAFDIDTNWPAFIQGYAKVLGPARLAVVFGNTNEDNLRENYTVLGTDYTTYALVFSCASVDRFFHAEYLWILTRERFPSEETVAIAKKLMVQNGISESHLTQTIQEGCPAPGKYN